jgi:double-stranded uracil-DNA glycosylase
LARCLHYAHLVAASLPDIIAPKLDVLIVAINPSLQSAEAGHSFSSTGNPFWRLLHEAGLTRVLLRAEDERRLLEFGIGLTSSAVRPTRAASELTRRERLQGAERVERLVAELRPRYVALLGLTLYPVFFPTGMERGPGLKEANLASSRVFVLPNPSGRNRAYPGFEKKLIWYRALADVVKSSKAKRT